MSLAQQALAQLQQQTAGLSAEQTRDALLEAVPALSEQFGAVQAVAAAEVFEQIRAAEVGGTFQAVVADAFPAEAVQQAVRWSVRTLFQEQPDRGVTFNELSRSMQRWVLQPGRDTIAQNVARDSRRPTYARIPTGEKTCAFCLVMASRGFVYSSKAKAGDELAVNFSKFHDDCDCQIVPSWDRENPAVEGYRPEQFYDMYQQARSIAGGDLRDIVGVMRRMFPDDLTDGVESKDSPE